MSGEVVSLRPGIGTESDRKAQFLDAVGHSFDLYVQDFGVEPDAIVHVLGGVKQTARLAYNINGDSQDGKTSMLALAHAVLVREIVNPD